MNDVRAMHVSGREPCKEELEQAQADEQAVYDANLEWRAAWEAEQGRPARKRSARWRRR